MPTCVEGHTSAADDFCDVCGSPIGAISAAAQPLPSPALEVKDCPECGVPMSGRFCETCGHDSALPQPVRSEPVRAEPVRAEPVQPSEPAAAPVSLTWTAVVAADRELYERVVARQGPDTVEFPQLFLERRIALQQGTTLIGRHNRDQGVDPEIDLGIHPSDRGVSTQHAVLRLRDAKMTITDLGSTNGTSLNGCDDQLPAGEEMPVGNGDRIHVGAWTTITIVRTG